MFKFDQKGISLPIVLAVTALIGANTYYFMSLQKDASVKTSITKTDLREDAEKRRIMAALADYRVCTQNFKDQNVDTLQDISNPATSPITSVLKNGVNVIKRGTDFQNDTGSPAFQDNKLHTNAAEPANKMKVRRIYFREVKYPVSTPSDPPPQVRYSLVVEYETLTPITATNPTDRIAQEVGKTTLVVIPLYVDVDASRNVVRCYARPDNATTSTGLFQAVEAACQESSGPSHLYQNGCEHLISPVSCKDSTGFNFIAGIRINASNHSTEFICKIFSDAQPGIIANCNPGMYANGVINSEIQCTLPNHCPSGGTIIKSASGYVCSKNCTGQAVWLRAGTPGDGTPVCFERSNGCAAGYYAQSIPPNGSPTCRPIAVKNKSCAANQYATHFDAQSLTGDVLHCANFTKARSCASPNKYTYISSLNSLTPSCSTYLN